MEGSRAAFAAKYETKTGATFEAGKKVDDVHALHDAIIEGSRAECRANGWDVEKEFARGKKSFFKANPDICRAYVNNDAPQRMPRGG